MIIGTAGHIDHGKSALVTALTGRTMDRLAEERRRGITIDLNFAPLRFEGLPPAGIVDVPGHEDFVRTMVAGASGIDLVLLVVDAAQGPQPQTWEHLAIVEQLGVPRGIPVITKADLAEPEWRELVAEELTQRLRQSSTAFEAPIVVSAVTGLGIAELAARLRAHVERPARERPEDGFRMPIDRAFSVAGVGTVVTGTPWSGSLKPGDLVRVLPADLSGRVRSIEAYGTAVSIARPGARTAVGLAGIERASLRRGEVLVDGRLPWRSSTALDTLVALLPGVLPLRRHLRVRVHLGTAEVLARVYPRSEIGPGRPGMVRLALEEPLVARGNDRFVLRSYSPVGTIGGGRVLDPLPPRRAPWPPGLAAENAAERAEALIARRPNGVVVDELPLLLGEPDLRSQEILRKTGSVSLVGGRYLPGQLLNRLRGEAFDAVRAFHERRPGEPGISLETLRRALTGPAAVIDATLHEMLAHQELKLVDGAAALPDFEPKIEGREELMEVILAELEGAGLTPPTVSELEQKLDKAGLLPLLRKAVQEGRLVAVEGNRFYSPEALQRFVQTVKELAVQQEITPAALRDRLNLSRKYLIPLLEWADRTGITRRVGDGRVLV